MSLVNSITEYTMCCHGGVPFINLSVWPLQGTQIQPIDEPERTLENCQKFAVRFEPRLHYSFTAQNGTFGCKCPKERYGPLCQNYHSQAQSGGGGTNSFKIFLYLAIIPLAFGLLAAVGGFICRLCTFDCFDCPAYSCRKGRCVETAADDTSLTDEEFRERCQNSYNRCLDAERKKQHSLMVTYASRYGGVEPPPTATIPLLPVHASSGRERQEPPDFGELDDEQQPSYTVIRELPPPPYDGPPSYQSIEDLPADVSTQTSLIL